MAVFAVGGALEAARKQLDIVGFLFVTAVTGIGGGTATFGGLSRDVVCTETPLLLKREVYATAAACRRRSPDRRRG